MLFLEDVEIKEWRADHGVGLGDDGFPTLDHALIYEVRVAYARGARSGRERGVAEDCVQILGSWEECLLWVTQWGIWGSGEDWPTYYAARGRRGERRSLGKAPGHLFESAETADLAEFLTLVMENAWDAYLLPAYQGAVDRLRILVSHDELVEVRSVVPVTFSAAV